MISDGIVNALVAWAGTDPDKLAQLTAERDACVAAILSGGKPATTLTSASVNGKTFGALVNASVDEKLTVFTAVLTQLGVITAGPSGVIHSNFSELLR